MRGDRRCRCHSGRKFRRCCGPWLAGRPAPTPESLMRSRYTAYALGRVDHILATTLEGSPAWDDGEDWADRVRDWCAATRFVGLSVLESPSPVGDRGLVAFAATLSQDGVEWVLRERSAFHRRNGAWFYHSGAAL